MREDRLQQPPGALVMDEGGRYFLPLPHGAEVSPSATRATPAPPAAPPVALSEPDTTSWPASPTLAAPTEREQRIIASHTELARATSTFIAAWRAARALDAEAADRVLAQALADARRAAARDDGLPEDLADTARMSRWY